MDTRWRSNWALEPSASSTRQSTSSQLGQPFAVKVIDLGKADSRNKSTYLPRELKALIGAKDEHLIHVFDVIKANRKMRIFMEFASNGDIFGYARKNKGIREALACQWFYQVGSGLFFLHEKMLMAHRDIKLDNMLLDAKWVAKLADFGFAKQSYDVQRKALIGSHTLCGTLPYECPQILLQETYNAFKADTWSMGISLFVMLHRNFPFDWHNKKKMVALIQNYPGHLRSIYSQRLPPEARRLIEDLLNPQETKRASVHCILSSTYLRSKLPK